MNKSIPINSFVSGAIAPKYAPPYATSTVITNKLVSNSFIPSLEEGFVLTDGNLKYFPKAEVLPVTTLLAYLGYTRKQIRDLRVTKHINLIPAGMGGINNGIMYWLNKINKELLIDSTYRLHFHAFDDDVWDITNVPRIHFDSLGVDPLLPKTKWVSAVLRRYNSSIDFTSNTGRVPVGRLKEYKTELVPIVFGATDMTTRNLLSKSKDCVYFQITQSDHNLNMFLNPEITMKSRDVYGTIFLNEFHIMTLKAAVTLLEVAKKHSRRGIDVTKEHKVELFSAQDFDHKYGVNGWLGVVPDHVTYSRHNGYRSVND